MKKAKKPVKVKLLVALLAVVLVVGCAIGGTLAWLTDDTQEVVNTFTDSKVEITLSETKNDFKMIPGYVIEKDPVVTVLGGSEACWLFVQIDESESPKLDDYISYRVILDDPHTPDFVEGWTQGDGVGIPANVYYLRVDASDADQAFHVLGGDEVTVLDTVTQAMMDAIDGLDSNGAPLNPNTESQPTLTFQAYAIQLYKTNGQEFSVEEAWAQIKPVAP